MNRRSLSGRRLLAVSTSAYRALLVFYPRTFRREFGPHLTQVFGDVCHQVQSERGTVGILELWMLTICDLAVSALHERQLEGVHMPRLPRQIVVRMGGAAALLGGALLLLSFVTHPHGPARAVVPGSIVCLLLGMVGFHALLWGHEGWLGRLGFALMGVGLVLGLIGMAGSALGVLNPNPIAPIINTGEHAGLVFIGAGMLLWGILVFRMKALGRWSIMPLVIGLFGMIGIVFLNPALFSMLENSVVPQIFAACWILLGYALITRRIDASDVTPPIAAV